MNMEPRPITTPSQHAEALAQLEDLLARSPDKGSPESDRIQILALLIDAFEREHFPISAPTPVEAIRFRMDEMGLSPRDLEPFIGSRSKVSEVLSGKTALSIRMIRELHRGLGIPLEVLVAEPKAEGRPQDDIPKLPLKEMAKRGWIEATAATLRDRGEELTRAFLAQVEGPLGAPAMRRSLHRRTGTASDSPALLAWLGRAQIVAKRYPTKMPFAPDRITPDFLRGLARLSSRSDGPKLARAKLAGVGIILVVVPALPRLHADGAAFLSTDKTPIIALTLRYDRTDNFWFTLFHEVAHILRHLDSGEATFVDDLDMMDTRDPSEIDADAFARDCLIPRSKWSQSDALNRRTAESIVSLAAELNIHPAIVAGRLRTETKRFNDFTNLVGHRQVRVLFSDEWK